MSEESPAERALHAQHASLTHWSRVDNRFAATQHLRDGYRRKLEREIDPNGELAPEELARRVEYARRAQLADMSRKAAKAAREKREARKASQAAAVAES